MALHCSHGASIIHIQSGQNTKTSTRKIVKMQICFVARSLKGKPAVAIGPSFWGSITVLFLCLACTIRDATAQRAIVNIGSNVKRFGKSQSESSDGKFVFEGKKRQRFTFLLDINSSISSSLLYFLDFLQIKLVLSSEGQRRHMSVVSLCFLHLKSSLIMPL